MSRAELKKMNNKTLDYYNKCARNFIEDTASVDFSSVRQVFFSYLPPNAFLLDLGCGSGRDTKAFLESGYQVDAVDGSEEICRTVSEMLQIPVRNLLFQELCETEKYDGIWACASILHVPKQELSEVLEKIHVALKQGGIFYTSFKYGTFEGERNGRYFTDFTEETFRQFLDDVPGFSVEKMWITGDVRDGRGNERWLNMILRKN